MPHRPGLDDDDEFKALVDIWTAGSGELDRRVADVYSRIRAETDRLRSLPDGADRAIALNAARRLDLEARRLNQLQDVANSIVADATAGTRSYIDGGGLERIYAAGAGRIQGLPFAFTLPHRAAVEALSADVFDDVLAMTSFIDADSKAFVRRVGRQLSGFKLTGGTTVREQAKRLERDLRTEFLGRGMNAVVYKDGSRHGFGEYASMLLRTKTSTLYNAGTLNHGRLANIRYYEILDGVGCGLTSHHDPETANGLIVPYEIASAYPLSHPNCRRAIAPRPDVNRDNVGDVPSVQSVDARSDQEAFERALERQTQAARANRRRRTRPTRGRSPRSRRTTRQTRQRRNTPAQAPPDPGRLARRARIDQARADHFAAQEAKLARQRADLLGDGTVPADVLNRWGVSEGQYLEAKALTTDIKRDIRKVAKAEADDLGKWLNDNDLGQLTRPTRLKRRTDLVSGARRSVRTESGYDFLETLDDAAAARVRQRMTDSDLFAPDLVAEQVRRKTGLDMTDDEALNWVTDRWLHEDALRSLASGRIPKYADPGNLVPGDYALDGYDITKLFNVDADDAVGHVAAVQVEAAERFAGRVLGQPRHGPAPWTMDAGEYVRELEALEDVLSSTQLSPGVDPGPTYRFAQDRIRELAPRDLDETGALSPMDLFEAIRITARTAGLLDGSSLP